MQSCWTLLLFAEDVAKILCKGPVVAKGLGGGGGMDWEFGISRCKLLYIEWINKVPLYSTGNYIQYPVINPSGREYKEECIYIEYICITESLCCAAEINKTL